MDPNATWERIRDGLCDSEWEEVVEHCNALTHWLTHGGLLPSLLYREAHSKRSALHMLKMIHTMALNAIYLEEQAKGE